MKETASEFSRKIKEKYPQYKDVDDIELAKAMIAKHPAYADKVSFEDANQESPKQKPQTMKEILHDVLQVAPWVLSAGTGTLPEKMLISGLIQGVSKAGEEYTSGKSIPRSLMSGAESGLTGAIGEGAFNKIAPIIGKGYAKASPYIAKGISKVGSALSSVPAEDYERAASGALKGKGIFGKTAKEDQGLLSELADKASDAATNFRRKHGAQVGAEKAALRVQGKYDENLPILDKEPVLNNIRRMIEGTKDSLGISSLNKKETDLILGFERELSQPDLPIDSVNRIKNEINDLVLDRKNINKRLTVGDGILSQIAGDLDTQVASKAPELNEANKKASQAIEASDFVNSNLRNQKTKGQNLAGAIRGDTVLADTLREVNAAAPEDLQFIEPAQEAIARAPFRSLFPGQGGGSGSAQGAANILRNMIMGGAATAAGLGHSGGLLVAPPFSPLVHKGALLGLEGAVKGVKAASPVLQRLASPAASKLEGDALVNEMYRRYLEDKQKEKVNP